MKRTLSITALILVSTLIIILCIFAFVQPVLYPAFDLTKTGAIGDTIGGIAAPIVGILAAILVYLSFKEQFEANRLQRNALNDEIERANNAKDMDIFLRVYKRGKLETIYFMKQLDHVLFQCMVIFRRVLKNELPRDEDELVKK